MVETNVLKSKQKHLLLEEIDKANTSFIANINTVCAWVKDANNISKLNAVPTLQQNYNSLSDSIITINSKLNTYTSDINGLKARVSTLESLNISNKLNTLSLLERRVSVLETSGICNCDPTKINAYYTKMEVNDLLSNKANTISTYTKTDINTLLNDKLDIQQSKSNAGKILVVDADGKIDFLASNSLSVLHLEEDIDNLATQLTEKETAIQNQLNLKADKLTVDAKFNSIDASLANIGTQLDTIDASNNHLDEQLDALNTAIGNINLSQYSGLSDRILELETKQTQQDTSITSINDKNTEQDTRLTQLENTVHTQSADYEALQNFSDIQDKVNSLENRIIVLEQQIATLDGRLQETESSLFRLTNRSDSNDQNHSVAIESMQSDISTLQSKFNF